MQPSQSYLRLQDWQTSTLSVADICALRLRIPRLAYLSTCFAANIKTEGLSDEGLNLVAACQLAGFPTVTGTMWHVEEEYSSNAVQIFYSGLVGDEGININKASGKHYIGPFTGLEMRQGGCREFSEFNQMIRSCGPHTF